MQKFVSQTRVSGPPIVKIGLIHNIQVYHTRHFEVLLVKFIWFYFKYAVPGQFSSP